MISVEVVILAKSIKHKQYCVAGKCVANGVWVRPVASKDGAELQKSNVLISNNYGQFEAKPLQKVIMNFVQHAPLIFQPENFVVDGEPWRQNYKINLSDLEKYLDKPNDIWGSGDKISAEAIRLGLMRIESSLYLLRVRNLLLEKLYFQGRSRRRVKFSYGCIDYDLSSTDPDFDSKIGKEDQLESIVCISLGEVFSGFHFKIVAAIY